MSTQVCIDFIFLWK